MDSIKKIYIDSPSWANPPKEDDFVISIGKRKSNSVYHVMSCNSKPRERITRHYLKVLSSDLITALRRDKEQRIIPMTWYKR